MPLHTFRSRERMVGHTPGAYTPRAQCPHRVLLATGRLTDGRHAWPPATRCKLQPETVLIRLPVLWQVQQKRVQFVKMRPRSSFGRAPSSHRHYMRTLTRLNFAETSIVPSFTYTRHLWLYWQVHVAAHPWACSAWAVLAAQWCARERFAYTRATAACGKVTVGRSAQHQYSAPTGSSAA